MLNRTQAPPIKDAIEFDLQLKPAEQFILDNGVHVYAIDAGSQEVLQMELVFFAGNSVEQQNTVASATNYLLKNGTKTRTAFQLNEHFDFYGSYCNRACYNETATLSLHTLSKHLPVLLPVIKDMITDSVFSEEELATFKQNSKQKLAVNLKKCDFTANRLVDARLYGNNHPYGRFTEAADYDALTTALLKDHYDKHYLHGHCVIFIAGKLPSDIQTMLNGAFGKLQLQGHRLAAIPVFPPNAFQPSLAGQGERVINDASGVQGAIRIARLFPNRHHPDFQKVMVLNTLFGGFFGSRLMSNIREDKGYTYGIHSYVQNHIGNTSWMISTETGKDVCEAAVAEIYKEMQVLQHELIDEEELLLVRNYMIGIILGDLDGPFQIIGRWKNLVLNNLDESFFYNSIKVIKSITAEELRLVAKKYLQPGEFYELVVV